MAKFAFVQFTFRHVLNGLANVESSQ